MPLPSTPHDALFRLLVSDPGRAAVLLADYLPPEVAERLDLGRPPEHVEGTAVDGEGRSTQADAIFRVRTKDGGTARIYVLLEHKARSDLLAPLQLMRYILRLWTMEAESGGLPPGRLPPAIPMVFFNGPREWTAPLSIQEMIDAPEGLGHLARAFGSCTLHDLPRIAPENLFRSPEVGGALLAMGRAFADDITDAEADTAVEDTEFGRYMAMYIVEQLSLTPERIKAAIRRICADPEADPEKMEAIMGTSAQVWLKQGEERGRAAGMTAGLEKGRVEGLEKGRAEALARLLDRRFGPLPRDVRARIDAAGTAEIETWFDAAIDAPDLASVFAGRGASH